MGAAVEKEALSPQVELRQVKEGLISDDEECEVVKLGDREPVEVMKVKGVGVCEKTSSRAQGVV